MIFYILNSYSTIQNQLCPSTATSKREGKMEQLYQEYDLIFDDFDDKLLNEMEMETQEESHTSNLFFTNPFTPSVKECIKDKIHEIVARRIVAELQNRQTNPYYNKQLVSVPIELDRPAHNLQETDWSLMEQRICFLNDVVKKHGPMPHNQLLNEISKVDYLHDYDQHGNRIPITKEILEQALKKGSIILLKSSSKEGIINRYAYAKRYLQITQEKQSEICFLGQYSFSTNSILSGCSGNRRASFINNQDMQNFYKVKQAPKEEDPTGEKWGKNIQLLVVMSLQGIVYYQLYGNIFAQCKFYQTVAKIGERMTDRNPHRKKYLILETSFFHSKKDLRKFQNQSGITIIFLPPQTPMLNPTVYLFNELKHLVKSKAYKFHNSCSSILTEILQSIGGKNMQGYYSCIRPYLELSLRQRTFK